MSGETVIRVPDIGDFEDVEVVEILVGPGDQVEVEDALVSIESEKATMEIPSPVAGLIHEVRVALGDSVSEGDALMVVLAEAASASVQDPEPAPPVAPSPEPAASVSEPLVEPLAEKVAKSTPAPAAPEPKIPSPEGVHAGPGVRRRARELGVNLAEAQGTGPLGRILQDDVTDHVRATMQGGGAGQGRGVPPVPAVDFSRFGPVREEPLAKIRRVSAQNLSRSWLNAPHVTQHDEADLTQLEGFRRECKEEAGFRPEQHEGSVHAGT